MKPGTYYIGTEYNSGKGIFLTVHDGPQCGWECECCEYLDGTAPADHARDCQVFDVDGYECTCEGAVEKAIQRKRDSDG
jgi:hypothetical protein